MPDATLRTHPHILTPGTPAETAAILRGRPLAGVAPLGIPKVLAGLLEHWEGTAGYPATATGLLEWLTGAEISLDVIRPLPGEPPGERPLTDAERYRLGAAGVASCRWRHAVLRVPGGMAAAAVSLMWLPARLPWDTCADLDAGAEPAGRVLGRLPGGVRRTDRRALPAWTLEEITGQTAAVTSSAVLIAGGQRVAVAEEWVLREFAESLAG